MFFNKKKKNVRKFQNLTGYFVGMGWRVEIPTEWAYEYDVEERMYTFYLKDSDLTVYITPHHAQNHFGELAPVEELERVYLQVIANTQGEEIPVNLDVFKDTCYTVKAFEGCEIENGENVYHIKFSLFVPGDMLFVNVFGDTKEECMETLEFLKTISKQ